MKNMDMNYFKTVRTTSIVLLLTGSSILCADEPSSVSNKIAETTKDYLSDPARTGSIVGSIIAGSAAANPLAPLLGSVAGFIIGKSSAFSDKGGSTARSNAYNNRSLIPNDGSEIASLAGLSSSSSLATISENGVVDNAGLDAGNPSIATISLGQAENTVVSDGVDSVPDLAAAQPDVTNNQTGAIVIVESIDQSAIAAPSEPLVTTDLLREIDMGARSTQTTNGGLPGDSSGVNDLQQKLADACSNYQTLKTASLNCYYYVQ